MNYRFSDNKQLKKQANNEIKQQVIERNKKLNNMLSQLKQNISLTNTQIEKQNNIINQKTNQIYNQNRIINNLDKSLETKENVLSTKNRQLELGKDKNYYKQGVMLFFLILNIVIVGLIVFLLFKLKRKNMD